MRAGSYLYALRPNAQVKSQTEAILREAIPCDLDPRRTISLPVRGSDKCSTPFDDPLGRAVSPSKSQLGDGAKL